MIPPRYDVLAIGNALVDVLCHKDDDFVAAQGLRRGLMQPIAPDRAVTLHAAMGRCEEVCGGSAANTMAALARLGLRLAFVGQVGDDRLGRLFADDMAASGIAFPLPPIDAPTGRCLIIVSPDGHRTMNTAIGASEYLPPAAFDSAIAADAAILYVEGYMWRTDQPRAAARAALEVARANRRRTAFTLSSEYCVQQHHDDFVGLLDAGLIDILFANEGELAELSGRSGFEAGVAWAAARVPLLIATRGPDGAVAIAGDQRFEAPAEPFGPIVDTTGAGDLFAAGVLAGLARDRDLPAVLRMGSIAAGRIIAEMGPRLPGNEDLAALIAARLAAA
ncbi:MULTISPECIES: adenosine kinase [unclassified Sphingomonas]|uniref:adenosine kinase n=1 Tax=unclassified Sphingomonas TaxID=196159 RepID=UPI0006F34C69|nr:MULTISPECIES: adenosine kinase [unclassified Sphingomonas]KQX21673.1 carbohydrate kinase [Sphingomonas sp. Root1294]KQY72988.1 carbohydrate kinase [Sphingomonas sp. Root50]KRB88214.1 carbohydrate kinase [Sphingomonas sp. Root720]